MPGSGTDRQTDIRNTFFVQDQQTEELRYRKCEGIVKKEKRAQDALIHSFTQQILNFCKYHPEC